MFGFWKSGADNNSVDTAAVPSDAGAGKSVEGALDQPVRSTLDSHMYQQILQSKSQPLLQPTAQHRMQASVAMTLGLRFPGHRRLQRYMYQRYR
jgi:hypothetical protein